MLWLNRYRQAAEVRGIQEKVSMTLVWQSMLEVQHVPHCPMSLPRWDRDLPIRGRATWALPRLRWRVEATWSDSPGRAKKCPLSLKTNFFRSKCSSVLLLFLRGHAVSSGFAIGLQLTAFLVNLNPAYAKPQLYYRDVLHGQ